MSAEWLPTDVYLTKRLSKMIGRIERLMLPSIGVDHDNYDLARGLGIFMKLISKGDYYRDINSTIAQVSKARSKVVSKGAANSNNDGALKVVMWDKLKVDLIDVLSNSNPNFVVPPKVQLEIDTEYELHMEEEVKMMAKEKLWNLQSRNGLPVMPGKWRKEAYPPRVYHPLDDYMVTKSIPETEAEELRDLLNTPLNGFLGQAYNYDDHGLTEEWMVTFKDGNAEASADDVIRTQLESLMEIMLVQVQDRVCTQDGVLDREPLVLGKHIKEVPVWGIDCYTRRMIELTISDRVEEKEMVTEKAVQTFIEKKLLPAINAQPADKAHNMKYALMSIYETSTSNRDKAFAEAVLKALNEPGVRDVFKAHPKGTGVICIDPNGIPPHVMVSRYLGEVYPPYRWCERLDVIEQAQQTFELKPTLPDFYNILLERPRQDPRGYGLLYVDASQSANVGSSCSHSCNANCTSAVVARKGKLCIVLTTTRHIDPGEELCMDYYSITTSDVEWRAAICLCGMRSCRGSFLSYATQDDLQQVLNQNCGPLWRYASLLRACGGRALTEVDQATLDRHGMKVAALGPNPPSWLLKYAADNLNFVEFERKALPCALMRPRNGSVTGYTFSAADMDARCVMEQRLQSMVCGFSMVQRVLARQEHQQQHEEHADKHAEGKAKKAKSEMLPVKALTAGDAAERVWKYMSDIPELLEEYVLARLQQHNKAAALGEAGGDLDDFSDGLVTENNSGTAKNSTGNGNSNSKSKKSSAVDSEEKKRQMVEKIAERLADEQKVEETIAEIKGILANKPVGLTGLREGCLALHRAIKNIANLSWSKARLGLLADVLVLWAHTSNYSCIQEYSKVESEPLHVPARELGTNIPRAKIFKPEVGSRRKAAAPSTSAKSIASTSSKSSDDETSVDKDEEGTTNMNVVIQENGVENEKGDQIADISFETEASATTSTNDQSGALTASTVVELDVTHTTTSTAAETAVTVAEASPSSLATDREVMSVSASSEKSIPNDIDKDSTAVVKSKVEDSNSGSGDKAPVIQMETEEATEADDSQPSSIEAAVAGSTSLLAQACTSSETSTTAGEMEKTTANTGSGRTAKYNFPFAAIMEPNEPVYTGSKVYEKLFVFWQLMGWYNAGTDNKVCAPDLFGCVQLPRPAACFGPSELQYGAKQRDALIAHLREEKAQTLPWPPKLKACFNPKYLNSTVTARSLLGSPMLDTALGQVDAVTRALTELLGIDKVKKAGAKAGDNSQFDSILPPEVPTNWVQCELCRKWRRVAWHVNSEELPDIWDCKMNFWDPENANCDAPQDGFDPDRESTLQYNSSVDVTAEEAYQVGMKFDVFCLKNRIFYEAAVKKIKAPKKEGEKKKILFHFLGWSSKFDEWIDMGSDRIATHNLHTDPTSRDPRAQERWQGVHGIAGTTSSAATAAAKKYEQEAEKKRKREEDKKKAAEAAAAAAAKKNQKKRKSSSSTAAGKKSRRSSASSAASTATATSAGGYSAEGMTDACDDDDDGLFDEKDVYGDAYNGECGANEGSNTQQSVNDVGSFLSNDQSQCMQVDTTATEEMSVVGTNGNGYNTTQSVGGVTN